MLLWMLGSLMLFSAWILNIDGEIEFLLLANRGDIRLISILSGVGNDVNSTILISNKEEIMSLSYGYSDRYIFWADISQSIIYRGTYILDKHPKNTTLINVQKILELGISSPQGLAYDWIYRKLYWTDMILNRIYVCNYDGTMTKVLYWQNLEQPLSIAVDPLSGLMFWTIWGETPAIEKAGLNGLDTTRKTIVSTELYYPLGLAIDFYVKPSRLYWVDSKLSYIASVNYDGKERKSILQGGSQLPYPYGLALSPFKLYWTDWNTHSIHSCNKYDGSNRHALVQGLFSPNGLNFFAPEAQPYKINPCKHASNACSHLCLGAPSPPFYTCACPTGIKLRPDNKTCENDMERMLLLARRSDLRIISLDTPDLSDIIIPIGIKAPPSDFDHLSETRRMNGQLRDNHVSTNNNNYNNDNNNSSRTSLNLKKPNAIQRKILEDFTKNTGNEFNTHLPAIKNAISVDYYPKTKMVYWSDTVIKSIRGIDLFGKNHRFLISHEVISPDGIAIDWISRNLYWTDAGLDRIQACKLDYQYGAGELDEQGQALRIVIIDKDGLDQPRGIALDPLNGYMYWTDWGRVPKLEGAWLDGTHRFTILQGTSQLGWPNGLTIDYGATVDNNNEISVFKVPKLYWNDALSDKIETINADGTGRRVIVNQNIPHSFGLSLMGNRLYWTDWQRRLLESCNADGTDREVIVKELPDLMGLKAVDNLHGYVGTNRCLNKNAGCSHFCLPLPDQNTVKFYAHFNSYPNGINYDNSYKNFHAENSNTSHVRGLPTDAFKCACPIGWELLVDSKTCQSSTSLFLLFSREKAVTRIALNTLVPKPIKFSPFSAVPSLNVDDMPDSTNTRKSKYYDNLQSSIKQASALEVDTHRNLIFWTDLFAKTINQACVNGSGFKILVETGLELPVSLALDWVTGHLYWSDMGTNRIEMISSTFEKDIHITYRKVIVWKALINPRSLAVDPLNGYLYWSSWGTVPKIEVSNLDGTDRRVLIRGLQSLSLPTALKPSHGNNFKNIAFNLGRANALSLDIAPHANNDSLENNKHAMGKLYWVDVDNRAIFSLDLFIPLSQHANNQNNNTSHQSNKAQMTRLLLLYKGRANESHPFGLTLYTTKPKSSINKKGRELLLKTYLYWSDWKMRRINRKVVTPVATNEVKDFLLSEQDIHNKNNHINFSNFTTYLTNLEYVVDLKLFHKSRQPMPITNACAKDIHKPCQHFCITLPYTHSFKCSCSTHYTLEPLDNKTCIAPSKFILLAHQTSILRLSFDTSTDYYQLPLNSANNVHNELVNDGDPLDTILNIKTLKSAPVHIFKTSVSNLSHPNENTGVKDYGYGNSKNVKSLMYDLKYGRVYWIQYGFIWRAKDLSSENLELLLPQTGFVEYVSGMNFNKHSNQKTSINNAHNSDSNTNTLKQNRNSYLSVNHAGKLTPDTGKIDDKNKEIIEYRPYDMVINPVTRQIIWSCLATNSIMLSWLDTGQLIGAILTGADIYPVALSLDYMTSYIFWINCVPRPQQTSAPIITRVAEMYTLERIFYDGTHRTVIVTYPPYYPNKGGAFSYHINIPNKNSLLNDNQPNIQEVFQHNNHQFSPFLTNTHTSDSDNLITNNDVLIDQHHIPIYQRSLEQPYRLSSIHFDSLGTRRLYWSDTAIGAIETSDSMGGDRKILTDSGLLNPLSVTLLGSRLYWLDADLAKIEWKELPNPFQPHISTSAHLRPPFKTSVFKGKNYTKGVLRNYIGESELATYASLRYARNIFAVDATVWNGYETSHDYRTELNSPSTGHIYIAIPDHPCSYINYNGNCSDICTAAPLEKLGILVAGTIGSPYTGGASSTLKSFYPRFVKFNSIEYNNNVPHRQKSNFDTHKISQNDHKDTTYKYQSAGLTELTAHCSCPLNKIFHDDVLSAETYDESKLNSHSKSSNRKHHTTVTLEAAAPKFCIAKPQECPEDHFSCHSGRIDCIPISWRCDGTSDCQDRSDESSAECKASNPGHVNGKYAANFPFSNRLRNGHNSFEEDEHTTVDGAGGYLDKSPYNMPSFDDQNSALTYFECSLYGGERKNIFKCASSTAAPLNYPQDHHRPSHRERDHVCIRSQARCDGYVDCPDASDELDCHRRRLNSLYASSPYDPQAIDDHKAWPSKSNHHNRTFQHPASNANDKAIKKNINDEMRFYPMIFIGAFAVILLLALVYATVQNKCSLQQNFAFFNLTTNYNQAGRGNVNRTKNNVRRHYNTDDHQSGATPQFENDGQPFKALLPITGTGFTLPFNGGHNVCIEPQHACNDNHVPKIAGYDYRYGRNCQNNDMLALQLLKTDTTLETSLHQFDGPGGNYNLMGGQTLNSVQTQSPYLDFNNAGFLGTKSDFSTFSTLKSSRTSAILKRFNEAIRQNHYTGKSGPFRNTKAHNNYSGYLQQYGHQGGERKSAHGKMGAMINTLSKNDLFSNLFNLKRHIPHNGTRTKGAHGQAMHGHSMDATLRQLQIGPIATLGHQYQYYRSPLAVALASSSYGGNYIYGPGVNFQHRPYNDPNTTSLSDEEDNSNLSPLIPSLINAGAPSVLTLASNTNQDLSGKIREKSKKQAKNTYNHPILTGQTSKMMIGLNGLGNIPPPPPPSLLSINNNHSNGIVNHNEQRLQKNAGSSAPPENEPLAHQVAMLKAQQQHLQQKGKRASKHKITGKGLNKYGASRKSIRKTDSNNGGPFYTTTSSTSSTSTSQYNRALLQLKRLSLFSNNVPGADNNSQKEIANGTKIHKSEIENDNNMNNTINNNNNNYVKIGVNEDRSTGGNLFFRKYTYPLFFNAKRRRKSLPQTTRNNSVTENQNFLTNQCASDNNFAHFNAVTSSSRPRIVDASNVLKYRAQGSKKLKKKADGLGLTTMISSGYKNEDQIPTKHPNSLVSYNSVIDSTNRNNQCMAIEQIDLPLGSHLDYVTNNSAHIDSNYSIGDGESQIGLSQGVKDSDVRESVSKNPNEDNGILATSSNPEEAATYVTSALPPAPANSCVDY